MPKKKKCPPAGPNMSYMISFGDTMTALLAFFIVLNSMAEEQSGANLHAGTGSFVSATSSFGLPGAFSDGRSKQPFQMKAPAPTYVVDDPTGKTEPGDGSGPDENGDDDRIIDRHKEQFHKFLNNVDRMSSTQLTAATKVDGEMYIDVLGSLPHDGPVMNEEISEAVKGVANMLRQPNREVELTVWCTSPAEVSFKRAVRQSSRLRDETIALLNLPPKQQARLTAVARPWPWRNINPTLDGLSDEEAAKKDTKVKRPAVSITVRVTSLPDPL